MANYYSVALDGSIKEYDSEINALANAGICAITESEAKKRNGEHTNNAFEYKLFSKDSNKFIGFGSYKLLEISTNLSRYNGYPYGTYIFDKITLKFSDKYGLVTTTDINSENNYFGVGKQGLSKAIKYLIEVSNFECYENFLLSRENEKLKDKMK